MRSRVIVAGANYGRVYLEALASKPDGYECVGLLASDSDRSRRLAAQFKLPIYRSVAETPASIDMVCAALGRRGHRVVLEFLERGTSVLCEHPVEPEFLIKALATARRNDCFFHVNGHFSLFECSRDFIRGNVERGALAPPLVVELTATDRSLYAALDIVCQSIGAGSGSKLRWSKAEGEFRSGEAEIGGVPIFWRCQFPSFGLSDGSPHYLVDYRIAFGFRTGWTTLLSMGGPLISTQNYASPPAEPSQPERSQYTLAELSRQRMTANLIAIRQIIERRESGALPPAQEESYLALIATIWQMVATSAGGGAASKALKGVEQI